MMELLCVAPAMVEPCEVLRFLQNGHISLQQMGQHCKHATRHTKPAGLFKNQAASPQWISWQG